MLRKCFPFICEKDFFNWQKENTFSNSSRCRLCWCLSSDSLTQSTVCIFMVRVLEHHFRSFFVFSETTFHFLYTRGISYFRSRRVRESNPKHQRLFVRVGKSLQQRCWRKLLIINRIKTKINGVHAEKYPDDNFQPFGSTLRR